MSSLALNNQQDPVYDFYRKYLWNELNNGKGGWVLRTIYCDFGNWCVENKYIIGDNEDTKLFWLKTIVPYLEII